MKYDTLLDSIKQAEHFIERAKQTLLSHEIEAKRIVVAHARSRYVQAGPRETGALRRASMDLSRALADLRQGR